MSTHKEAQSRTVENIEEIIERAVVKLAAKRVPEEVNEISILVEHSKALPYLDTKRTPMAGAVIKGACAKVSSPDEWLQDALDSLVRLAGPGLYRVGFRFAWKGAAANGVNECMIQFGRRSVFKSEKMEIRIRLSKVNVYDSGSTSSVVDQLRLLCDVANIPLDVSIKEGKIAFNAPSNLRFLPRSTDAGQCFPNELIVEMSWNPSISPAETLIRMAKVGAGVEIEGVWECTVDQQVDKGSNPSALYDLLLKKAPLSSRLEYYLALRVPDIAAAEMLIKENKIKQATLRLADMNLPDPNDPDDPDLICWLTISAVFKKGAFYLELGIDYDQKQFLPVVNSALGTQFK